MLWKWRLAPEINPMQYCHYKESCRLQLHVSRHLNPFHPAYMHKKWCRKIDANRQWHGNLPHAWAHPDTENGRWMETHMKIILETGCRWKGKFHRFFVVCESIAIYCEICGKMMEFRVIWCLENPMKKLDGSGWSRKLRLQSDVKTSHGL